MLGFSTWPGTEVEHHNITHNDVSLFSGPEQGYCPQYDSPQHLRAFSMLASQTFPPAENSHRHIDFTIYCVSLAYMHDEMILQACLTTTFRYANIMWFKSQD